MQWKMSGSILTAKSTSRRMPAKARALPPLQQARHESSRMTSSPPETHLSYHAMGSSKMIFTCLKIMKKRCRVLSCSFKNQARNGSLSGDMEPGTSIQFPVKWSLLHWNFSECCLQTPRHFCW